jgi:PEGA domain
MLMRSLPFRSVASLPLLAALTCAPLAAHAQSVSDADRAAARELYVQGVQLQESGRFGDALDRFERAQSVFSAPTHLLHIAECEAALGKLVESAETYHTLVRTPLPDGAPNAFVQAQKQGAAELTQVEPRLPSIRVLVRPDSVQNISVQVDGQAMSAALVGVQRPTDPGQHTVVVSAPGYAKASQRVALQEKENRDLTFVLQPSNGIIYGAAPTYAPPVQTAQPAPSSAPPPPPYGAPAPYNAPPEYPAPNERRPATGGFMMGPSLGFVVPGGSLTQSSGTNTSLGSVSGTGGALGAEAGFRFVRRLYLGIVFQHGFLSTGSASSNASSGVAVTATASDNYYGLNFAYISHPEGLAFYGEVGGGLRTLTVGASSSAGNLSQTYSGGEVSIGVGMHIKLGDWVRLIPKISVSGGQFSSTSCSGSTCPGGSTSTTNADTHTFVFIGVTGFVDFARKH